MPGMENFAPERTLTSSGFSPCAELLALQVLQLLERRIHLAFDFRRDGVAAHVFPASLGLDGEAREARAVRHWSFRPGRRLCRPGHLSFCRCHRLCRRRKKKTYLVLNSFPVFSTLVSGRVCVAMIDVRPSIVSRIPWVLCPRSRSRRNRRWWRIPLTEFAEAPNGWPGLAIFDHDHDFVEEGVHRFSRRGKLEQSRLDTASSCRCASTLGA